MNKPENFKYSKYSIYLDPFDLDELETLKDRFGFQYISNQIKDDGNELIKKEKTALTAFIKTIILNTHTFLQNQQYYINRDIKNLLKSETFKYDRQEILSVMKQPKIRAFMEELIKIRTISGYRHSNYDFDFYKENLFQFRTDKDTHYEFLKFEQDFYAEDNFKKIDYLSSLVKFFLDTSYNIQSEIIYIKVKYKLNNAFNNHTKLKINKLIVIPQLVVYNHLLTEPYLFCINDLNRNLIIIPFSKINLIDDLEEYYELTNEEEIQKEDITNIFQNSNKVISISFIKKDESFDEKSIIINRQIKSPVFKMTVSDDNVYTVNVKPKLLIDLLVNYSHMITITNYPKELTNLITSMK